MVRENRKTVNCSIVKEMEDLGNEIQKPGGSGRCNVDAYVETINRVWCCRWDFR
jgi:hypothetical protein